MIHAFYLFWLISALRDLHILLLVFRNKILTFRTKVWAKIHKIPKETVAVFEAELKADRQTKIEAGNAVLKGKLNGIKSDLNTISAGTDIPIGLVKMVESEIKKFGFWFTLAQMFLLIIGCFINPAFFIAYLVVDVLMIYAKFQDINRPVRFFDNLIYFMAAQVIIVFLMLYKEYFLNYY